jgi:hypothetical protein
MMLQPDLYSVKILRALQEHPLELGGNDWDADVDLLMRRLGDAWAYLYESGMDPLPLIACAVVPEFASTFAAEAIVSEGLELPDALASLDGALREIKPVAYVLCGRLGPEPGILSIYSGVGGPKARIMPLNLTDRRAGSRSFLLEPDDDRVAPYRGLGGVQDDTYVCWPAVGDA